MVNSPDVTIVTNQVYHHLQILSSSFIFLFLNLFPVIIQSVPQQQQCSGGDRCGSVDVPFPFYLNTPSSPAACLLPDAFRLSCFQLDHNNKTSSCLFLTIITTNNNTIHKNNNASQSYQVLQFFPDGVLVAFPNPTVRSNNSTSSYSSCVDDEYNNNINDLKRSFGYFEGNQYFGISTDNVLGLYRCDDSSLCKSDCGRIIPNHQVCNYSNSSISNSSSAASGCCYPLSDYDSSSSTWSQGDRLFSVLSSHIGCRGFSSWVLLPPSSATSNGNAGRHGLKLEWAFPHQYSSSYSSGKGKGGGATICAPNAYVVNATSVKYGIRCKCKDGFIGDGFAQGFGCFKSCQKDGKETYGRDCYMKRHGRRKLEVLAGILTLAFSIASLTAFFCLLKWPTSTESGTFDPNDGAPDSRSTMSTIFGKAYRVRLFTYHELEEATKGFDDCQKLVEGKLYAGVLGDGSNVVVHKVLTCESDERDLMQVLSQVELLSTVAHKNMALVLGCSIDRSGDPLVVYEYPANGTTLLQQLQYQSGEHQKIGLDWSNRLNIAAETASVLSFLQYDISPPILHHDLQSGCILLDEDFSVQISGFELLQPPNAENSELGNLHYLYRSDVHNLGVVLLEIIAGACSTLVSVASDLPTIALQKITSGKLEEVVDPLLYYHEQPGFRREQIEKVADLATRCLLFGGDGKLRMKHVARELVHIRKIDTRSGRRPVLALEETFSNSSLLQMISMSPDSIYVP